MAQLTRHEFLATLHAALQPRGYLEIGVLHGDSLRLAECPAFGVDPAPMVYGTFRQTALFRQTSDDFFGSDPNLGVPIDLIFIDGMHLFEFALRDFKNSEVKLANERTVIVFDDVLPRNQEEAAREQCPGDWTGDVWKVWYFLKQYRNDLKLQLVDTSPTGTLVAWDLAPGVSGSWARNDIPEGIERIKGWSPVPDDVLTRAHAVTPDALLDTLEAWCASL